MRRRRGKKATKRPDLSMVREALRDQREWIFKAEVIEGDNGSHYEIINDEIIVDLITLPMEMEISAVVGFPIGGSGSGVFSIPPLGSEVLVAIPDGDLDFQPTIIAVQSGTGAPSGLSESTIVIVAPEGGQVLVHDGDSGETEPVVLKSEYDALKAHIDAHIHPTSMGPSSQPTVPAPEAPGTEVLKAK